MLLEERKAKINLADKKGKTPLFIACEKNRETIVHLLLGKGASVDETDQHDSTALHISCSLAKLILAFLSSSNIKTVS
jgi:ankyrin repeat protein